MEEDETPGQAQGAVSDKEFEANGLTRSEMQ